MPLKSRYNANLTGGEVAYGNKVVTSIITLAVQEINGVASLQGRGARCDIIGDKIDVEVYVNVYNDVSCTDVAFRIQENVKRSVESMTEFKIGVINVNILGLTFKDDI